MLRTHFSYFHWAGLSGQLFKQLAFSFNENPFVFPNILGRTSIFLNQGSCVNTGNYCAGHWLGGVVLWQTRMATLFHRQARGLPGSWNKYKGTSIIKKISFISNLNHTLKLHNPSVFSMSLTLLHILTYLF